MTESGEQPDEAAGDEDGTPAQAVFDSSAILAVLYQEPGAEVAEPHLEGGIISVVNLVEVLTKIRARSTTRAEADEAPTVFAHLGLHIEQHFSQAQAATAGAIQSNAAHLGLSLGDRVCLALTGSVPGGYALTTDRAWTELPDELGITVVAIRG